MVWAAAACTTSSQSGEQANTEHVQSMFAAFNRHDWTALSDHYSDTAEFLDPSFGSAYVRQTRADVATKYAAMEKIFPNINDEVVTLVAQGDKVAVEFISTGSADTISFRLPISCILTLKNGKIVRDATYYDNCQ